MKTIYVLLPLPLSSAAYVYGLPHAYDVPEKGTFVYVPFGKKEVLGVVWDKTDSKTVDASKIKNILHIFECPKLPNPTIQLISFISAYTICPLGMALKMALPVPDVIIAPKTQMAYYSSVVDTEKTGMHTTKPNNQNTDKPHTNTIHPNSDDTNAKLDTSFNNKRNSTPSTLTNTENSPPALQPFKMTADRQKVLTALQEKGALCVQTALLKPRLVEYAGVSSAVIKGLVDVGAICKTDSIVRPYAGLHTADAMQNADTVHLNPEQQDAVKTLRACMDKFSPVLLDGVTGAGKTEVYFDSIECVLQNNKSILVLLPEIALTEQWLERFEKRFGFSPALWHSDISPAKRSAVWQGVLYGDIRIVVGARSALHLPFANLGLVIVDEEHDGSYKQEEQTLYNARDMAIYRAKISECPIILASATPSLETWENVLSKRYTHVPLTQRYGGAKPPEINLIDITKEKMPADIFISPTLHTHIKNTLDANHQTILFLNRRGFAPLTLCRTCGYRFQCDNCEAWLIKHKFNNTLQCHHCGHCQPQPNACPECEDTENMIWWGPGVERINEEIQNIYPDARVFIATSETLQNRKSAKEFIKQMNNREIDIVIGTQTIAKGYDFQHLALVGVIDGDMALAGGDLRAGERTFQLLHQVAGRSGRAHIAGQAFIQTANPSAPVLQALSEGERDSFFDVELSYRKIAQQPPYTRLVSVVLSDTDRQRCELTARALAYTAPRSDSIVILGPVQPQMAYVRGKHRMRFLVNAPKGERIQPIIHKWIHTTPNVSKSTRISIDVDPYTFM